MIDSFAFYISFLTWKSEPALAGPCEEPEVVGCGDNNGNCDEGKVCDDTSGN